MAGVGKRGGEWRRKSVFDSAGSCRGLYPGHKAMGWDGEAALHRGFEALHRLFMCGSQFCLQDLKKIKIKGTRSVY